jgi:transposase
MATKNKYRLTNEELDTIEDAIAHDKRPEVVKRATAIRLLHLGYPFKEVAQMLVVEQTSVYIWHQHWREKGIAGLANQPRSGRPRKGNAQYCKALEEVLAKEPHEYGYAFTLWTLDRLGQHLEQETGIALSGERLRVLLKELGYVYRRPKHSLEAFQDSQARSDAEALLRDLKNGPHPAILSFSLWTKQP